MLIYRGSECRCRVPRCGMPPAAHPLIRAEKCPQTRRPRRAADYPPLRLQSLQGVCLQPAGHFDTMSLLSLLLAPACVSTSLQHAAARPCTVRLASRRDLLPLSGLIDRAFAQADTDNWLPGVAPNIRQLSIMADLERRNYPWDDERHAQILAEDSVAVLVCVSRM